MTEPAYPPIRTGDLLASLDHDWTFVRRLIESGEWTRAAATLKSMSGYVEDGANERARQNVKVREPIR